MFILSWLPPHTLRISKRAKRINLKICPYFGLEIVMPTTLDFVAASLFLEKHRHWIEKNYQRLKPFIRETQESELPEKIFFPALNMQWNVQFIAGETKDVCIHCPQPNQLILKGNLRNKKMIRHALQTWLKQQAAQHLIPWLNRLSEAAQLPFAQTRICHAQSLWGSCSIKKNISLNCRLLFLSPELVEYVMLHELCHTVHLNHSKEFWDLLKQISPQCIALRKTLRYANRHLPLWVLR